MKLVLTTALLLFTFSFLNAQIITTVAGTDTSAYSGDEGQATLAAISGPYDIVADDSGNVYFTDENNQRVRKIDTAGIITTYAGNGVKGYNGDNIPATSAELNDPAGLAIDRYGNLYVADYYNDRIRKISTSGIITTVAGNGNGGYSGDGGPATNAWFNTPAGVAVDSSGNIYITDSWNFRVRKVDTSGIINTIAGNGTSGFSGDGGPASVAELALPMGIVIDDSGNIYIADQYNQRVRKISKSGAINTFAGTGTAGITGNGGQATGAQLNYPIGLALDDSGNVYIVDEFNSCIRKVSASGVINSFAGNTIRGFAGDWGPATKAELNWPTGVGTDKKGNVFIADGTNNRIRKVDGADIITTLAGGGGGNAGYSGDGGAATSAELNHPADVAIDAAGNIYIADQQNNRIRKVNTSNVISTFAGRGTAGSAGDGGPATNAYLRKPAGVAVDDSGNVYIADTYNMRVRKVNKAGIITTLAGNGAGGYGGDGGPATKAELFGPQGVAADDSGNVYIADQGNHCIRKVNAKGIITTVAGTPGVFGYGGDGGPAVNAEFYNPFGIAIYDSGYVADTYNNCIRKINASGIITTFAGDNLGGGYSGDGAMATAAQLNMPTGMVQDKYGNVYIADMGNSRIRMVDKAGVITTYAGKGTNGYNGDGFYASLAELYYPSGLALDANNNLYIADMYNNRIRKVSAPLGINEISNAGEISTYPQPCNGNFSVKIRGNETEIKNIEVYDMLGEKLYSQIVNSVQSIFNLDINLNNGMYILQVETSKGIINRRIEVIK